jgi:hypothetical protein
VEAEDLGINLQKALVARGVGSAKVTTPLGKVTAEDKRHHKSLRPMTGT